VTHRRSFREVDLVRSTTPHYLWRCIGCSQSLRLSPSDPRAGSGTCPRCDRCGDLTAPVHGVDKEPN